MCRCLYEVVLVESIVFSKFVLDMLEERIFFDFLIMSEVEQF